MPRDGEPIGWDDPRVIGDTAAFEFWAKRTDERGREIDVTVIAYGRSLTEALTRVLTLGIHRDVVVYE